MSGTDRSPEQPDEASPPQPPRSDAFPARGIDPPSSGLGPPPPPDFGIARPQSVFVPGAAADQSGIDAQRTSRPWAIVGIIAAIVAVLVLVLGLVVVGIGSLVSVAGDRGEAAPSSESGGPVETIPDPDHDDPVPGSSSVESSLQAMIDEYKTARDTGTLWSEIPDSEFNRTAVSAFLYLLTDLRLAASFGADTSDYLDRAGELERKLLNQEPLGSDISIKLSDRTFTYDGDTGEGGYTAN